MSVGQKQIAENRKARHDYFILDTMEAGLALRGTEVKSMRAGRVNLKDSYIFIQNNEAYIEGMHVSPYEQGNRYNVDPLRKRKLLLHKKEILKLRMKTQEQGLSIVPLKLYFKGDKIKVEIAVVRGKKLYDKRATEAKKTAQREIHRALRERERR
ncbi:MAG: SsrA-binding protein SmpB [Peptococcaceae bacterium]|nr:SsrA-binding protein SmpB [Peptococcaceae bacterium]